MLKALTPMRKLPSRLLDLLLPRREIKRTERTLRAQMAEMEQRIARDMDASRQQMLAMREQMAAAIIRQSLAMREHTVAAIKRGMSLGTRVARRAKPYELAEFFAKLEAKFPTAFPIWKKAFDAGALEYGRGLATSLSIEGNPGAEAFRKFLSLYAHGHVLDIGCGPQDFPSYFAGLAIERLAGIDPLPRQKEPRFEFAQGFAEWLPWPSEEFDTITVATSLDHVVSLDMTLEEVRRVLRPGGSLVLWVSFVQGAQPYDPLDPGLKPIDAFHLFHFDRDWFLKLMDKYFTLREEFAFDSQSHFYMYTKE